MPFRIRIPDPAGPLPLPTPTYWTGAACEDQTHVSNQEEDHHMIDSCKETTRILQELYFTCGVRQVRVLSPLLMIAVTMLDGVV